jgi:hypothetical protein
VSDLKPVAGGELSATIHIKRAATGKTETYELVGRTTPEEHEKLMNDIQERGVEAVLGSGAKLILKENGDGSNT